MPRQRVLAVCVLLVLRGLPVAAQQDDRARLKRAAADPPATGLMITMVVPKSQAAKAGLKVGDIIVSYDGTETPTLDVLAEAKARAKGKKTVPVEIVSGQERRTVRLEPGPIGVNAVSAKKGERLPLRPPATGVTFDWSLLLVKPQETWYAFSLDGGKTKKGFEHHILRVEGDKLILDSEVAFDGGEQWGLNHFLVRVVCTATPKPKMLSARMDVPLTGFRADGKLVRADDGARTWQTVLASPKDKKTVEFGAPTDLLSDYLFTRLAAFMPRREGACCHATLLNSGQGTLFGEAGLVCRKRETVDLRGKRVEAWRFESVSLGRPVTTVWGDDAGRQVKMHYGGAQASLTTRDEALADLDKKLEPRLKPLGTK